MLTALSATILLVSLFLFYINKNAKMALVLFVGNLFLLSSFLIESEDDLLDRCHSGDQAACTDLQHMSDSRLKRAYNSLQEWQAATCQVPSGECESLVEGHRFVRTYRLEMEEQLRAEQTRAYIGSSSAKACWSSSLPNYLGHRQEHSCKPATYVYCGNGLLKIFSLERAGFAWSGVPALQLSDKVEVYKGVEELVAENG